MITIDRFHDRLSYDMETGLFVWKKGRGPVSEGKVAGRPNVHGYIRIGLDGRDYLAHRLAWFVVHGEWPNGEIDHINGCITDNRICNLRVATREENCRNVKVHKRNRLGIKGVSERNDCKKRFGAKIRINGKVVALGQYETAEEAKAAYNEAAREHFGEFFRE
jgi:hypothetical protein